MTAYWDPKLYIDRDARHATADIPPPLAPKIGFVTQSPGDLFLEAKGLTSSTKALVTTLRSASEILTSRNEYVRVRNDTTSFLAVDVGASKTDEAARNLLVIPEEPVAVEEEAPVTEDVSITNDQEPVVTESQTTIENVTPTDPDQYVAPSGSKIIQTDSGKTTTISSFAVRTGQSLSYYLGGGK